MIGKLACGSLLAALAAWTPAYAQVIEIDDSGEARTYDGPTVHTGTGFEPIRSPDRLSTPTSSNPANLLAQAARSHGVDQRLLEAVAWQESRGRMNAVSVKGALGVMQLMPATAAELGVDPTNPADNIRGGAMYLRRQLDRFGSVPLALAAYNAGPAAVIRYGGVPPFRETRDYVSKIMGRLGPTTLPVPSILRAPLAVSSAVIEVPGL
ncbi:MAG: Membrane-bound lytic murein transglycosylase D [uncultured Sphingomonas sp.]|uniref:Membrane-bound lytic murein transglycosylase D n=1 Tax=uncultured Sphingomonas sp. TaxID=158754 RepID=A0A6J4T1Y9_9SPHN|nr:MAG: Membrane-bound lytic murein transglycosylase D [uncultured Sphingomonas sp.]